MNSTRAGRTELAERRRLRNGRRGVFSVLVLVIIVATSITLMLPAISMTKGELDAPDAAGSTVAAQTEEGAAAGEATDVLAAQDSNVQETDAAAADDAKASTADDTQADDHGEDAADSQEDGEGEDGQPAGDDGDAADEDGEGTDPGGEAADVEDADDPADDPDASIDDPDGAPMPAKSFYGELRDANDKVTLTVDVEAPEGALPEGASMQVAPVKAAEVQDAVEAALEQEDAGKLDKIQAVDITFLNADGEEVEPAAPVNVKLASKQIAKAAKSDQQPLVAHIDDEGAAELVQTLSDEELEARDIAPAQNEIHFDADAFSVYAVVYTVDFHWEVDGKTYDFSIPGGGFVSLSQIVETLGLSANDAQPSETTQEPSGEAAEDAPISLGELPISDSTREFIAEVASVEFSNPELMWVAKVEADTTVEAFKEENGVQSAFSAELTDEQIADINSLAVKSGDWALVSLRPFDTTETLTIAMQDGQVFRIDVTDAADATMVDDPDGNGQIVQTIKNPAGTTIDLFDYWIVDSLKNYEGMNGWPGHQNQNDPFGSYAFDRYDYTSATSGLSRNNNDVPMSYDSTRSESQWYVNNGSLRGNGDNQGINTGHAFKFYPGAAGTVRDYGRKIDYTGRNTNHATWTNNHDEYASINSWTGSADPTQGLVESSLHGGYPYLTNDTNLGTIDTSESSRSLKYLFDPDTAHSGKDSYPSVDQLLYVDKDGYYTYDSRYYSVDFSGTPGQEGGTFTLREQTADYESGDAACGFWPFGSRVNWHGMHINTQFSMPQGGQVKNPQGELKDMQFEFSGDDDTWLYIDGVLVGDGGGIHNRTEIDINFHTGVVKVTGKEDPNHRGELEQYLYLDKLFTPDDDWITPTDANGNPIVAPDGTVHKTFPEGSYHTFDMFYLERGGSESNLYIHYNMVSTADFTGHKAYANNPAEALERDQFQFQLIAQEPDAYMPKNAYDTGGNPVSGAGTVDDPDFKTGQTVTVVNGENYETWQQAKVFTTGVTEDGNINFGDVEIPAADQALYDNDEELPVYHYVVREVVPEDAVNAEGVMWSDATPAQRAAGGFSKNSITYDGREYYMTARVTRWPVTDAHGNTYNRYGLSKRYFTDASYTTQMSDAYIDFTNTFERQYGSVGFDKVDANGAGLGGAEFRLYNDVQCLDLARDKTGFYLLASSVSDTGAVTFDDVPCGSYYMKEYTAPAGCTANDTLYYVYVGRDGIGSFVAEYDPDADLNGMSEQDYYRTQVAHLDEILNWREGELVVQKKWLDEDDNVVDGTKDVTVQLRRKVVTGGDNGHNVSVTVHRAAYSGYVFIFIPVSNQAFSYETSKNVSGSTVTVVLPRSLSSGLSSYSATDRSTGENLESNIEQSRTSYTLTINNVSSDVDVHFEFESDSYEWDFSSDANTIRNNLSITGIGSAAPDVTTDDPDFPSDAERERATKTLTANGNYVGSWTIGNGDGYDFPVSDGNVSYLYYVVELGPDGNALDPADAESGLIRIENNDGITSGSITAYNRAEKTAEITINKVDSDGEPLAGAWFSLTKDSEIMTSLTTEPQVTLNDKNWFQITGDAASLKISELGSGSYSLKEEKAPDGYLILEQPITFTVENGEVTNRSDEGTGAVFTVTNEPGAELPHTGGPGVLWSLLVGALLTVGASICLLTAGRKRTHGRA